MGLREQKAKRHVERLEQRLDHAQAELERLRRELEKQQQPAPPRSGKPCPTR